MARNTLTKGKNDMPEISIIVPVYNVEPYLRQCLDSVLAQSFANFELILIDDGSKDNSGAICNEYAARDDRIHVIHQKNKGQGYARNVGIDQAKGKYIIFLDSDDYWLPSTLEILYAEAERNQTQVIVFGARLFWEDEEESKTDRFYRHTVDNGIVCSGTDRLKKTMDAKEYHSEPWSRFCLLDYIRKAGLRFDEGIIHEDVRFSFLSILYAERVECIDEQLYQYRQWSGSTMNSKSVRASAIGYHICLDGLLDVFESHSCSLEEEALLRRYCIFRSTCIRDIYIQALKLREWKTARWIQRDTRQTLKRLRTIPDLPFSVMLTTYSLFLGAVVSVIKRTLRWLAAGKS